MQPNRDNIRLAIEAIESFRDGGGKVLDDDTFDVDAEGFVIAAGAPAILADRIESIDWPMHTEKNDAYDAHYCGPVSRWCEHDLATWLGVSADTAQCIVTDKWPEDFLRDLLGDEESEICERPVLVEPDGGDAAAGTGRAPLDSPGGCASSTSAEPSATVKGDSSMDYDGWKSTEPTDERDAMVERDPEADRMDAADAMMQGFTAYDSAVAVLLDDIDRGAVTIQGVRNRLGATVAKVRQIEADAIRGVA